MYIPIKIENRNKISLKIILFMFIHNYIKLLNFYKFHRNRYFFITVAFQVGDVHLIY